ncbi:MAG: alkaline phosphatase D family protein, partial [Nocardioidaceae bacterium]
QIGKPIRFRTDPDGSAPFTRTWAYTSCQVLPASNPLYADGSKVQIGWQGICDYGPDLGWFSGDYGYWSKAVGPTSPYTDHLKQYRKQTNAFPLMAKAMSMCCWDQESDDHEFGNYNPDSFNNPVKQANTVAMEKFFAMHPMADQGSPRRGAYGSYMFGSRIRVVLLDAESMDRSPSADPDGPAKTFLGAPQDAWLRDLLVNHPVALNIVICGKGFLGESDTPATSADKIWNYPTWRRTYAQMIRDNAVPTVWMGGDRHFNGYCSAANNPYGTGPVWLGSGISASSHLKASGENYNWTYGDSITSRVQSPVMQYLQGTLSDDNAGTITLTGTSREVHDTWDYTTSMMTDPAGWVLTDGDTATDTWRY